MIKIRICQGISEWTGQPCSAKAVNENTVKKGTREFLDPRFCQMHQPDKISKKKCVCPHCTYHRSMEKINTTDVYDQEFEEAENLFGVKKQSKNKVKKQVKKNKLKKKEIK